MRTRAVLGSIFASITVLTVGWQAGNAVIASSPTPIAQPIATAPAANPPAPAPGTASTTGAPAPAPAPAPPPAGTADGTYNGSSVNTQFGSVQVSVTISGGAITDVTALKLTDDGGESVQISNRAAPVLRKEVLSAQSTRVSNVGGATYTTEAYLMSVQSALDQAGF